MAAGASDNQIIYWSQLPGWRNQTLTPNPDTLYYFPFFNTRDAGPVVLDIPPEGDGSLTGSIDDAWQGARLEGQYRHVFKPPYFADTHWAVPATPEVIAGMQSGFAEVDSYPVDARAATSRPRSSRCTDPWLLADAVHDT